jgi:tripartite-type tricarboxylate transporter receptor subunit TctC
LRVDSAPEIPTLAEQGIAGMNLDTWNALYVPAGTPKAIVARLSAEVQKILAMPDVRKRIEATGSILHPSTAEDLRRMTAEEFEQYRRLATETKIHLD